jgi:hypothetical protein
MLVLRVANEREMRVKNDGEMAGHCGTASSQAREARAFCSLFAAFCRKSIAG